MDGGGRRSPRLTASGEESVERVPKRNNRSVSPPPPAQTGVKARPRREPVRSGKGASQGTVVGPALAKTGRDRAAGVEEELVDLPAWSAEEDEEEEAAGTGPGPEPELPAGGGAVVEAAAVQDLVAGARGAEAKVAAGTEAVVAAGPASELLRGLEERLSAHGIEVALGDMTGGGQLKTNKRVQFAGLQHRSAPFPADPAHPRAVWLRAIQRGMSFRSLRVARGTADAGRITANIRRLLPSDLLRLPSARYVSAKSCRKTMASAANAAGVPLRAIQQHGLWGEKSETAARNYIDRSYPIQPYTALVFDFLLDVGQAAVIMAI
jgi:hypothetical protein